LYFDPVSTSRCQAFEHRHCSDPWEPNWEPATTVMGPPRTISSHYDQGETACQATSSTNRARFESAPKQ
jgi:hypothetical protein